MQTWTVLVVDDQEGHRTLFSTLLETHPRLRLFAAVADGRAAITAVTHACPDAIILDVQMPVMDGISALPLLRRSCPYSVIVMYTSEPEDAGGALDRGADLVVGKTEDVVNLLDRLVELCSRRAGPTQ